jgi:hypothetical protein
MKTGHEPKNKIVPHIVKDFFTDQEIELLLATLKYQKEAKDLEKFFYPVVLSHLARMQIEVMYPEHIRKKIEKFASEIVGEEVFMLHNRYLSYNQEHSPGVNPKLPVHYDLNNYFSKLTLDYQLSSNIDWPIVIEGKSFSLKDHDLLVFWGAGQVHWREPVLFKKGDNVEVLTMHFSKKEDFKNLDSIARAPETIKQKTESWKEDPLFVKYEEEYNAKEESFKEFK